MHKFKYDIALSFLARDENIAQEIYERLKERYNVFLYSEQQKELAGRDGESAFKKVFESETKLVVVLYRSEWGSTPWTRMEQTGIRDRAYNTGYDFCTFLALEEKPKVPDWFPKQRLYASVPRFGIEQAVTVVESRAQEAGIESRELTLTERAQMLERQRQFESARTSFLSSYEGVRAAEQADKELRALLSSRFADLEQHIPSLRIEQKTNDREFGIAGVGPALMVHYRQAYGNSLTDSKLIVGLFEGGPPLRTIHYFNEPQRLRSIEFQFDRTEEMPTCWHHAGRYYNTEQAAELIIKFWLGAQPIGSGPGLLTRRQHRH